MSRGLKPYQTIKNSDVAAVIENGERLPIPKDCSPFIYQIMLDCWSYDPSMRPNFREILDKL